MTSNRAFIFLVGLMIFILSVDCECDDGGGLQQAAPRVEKYYVGTSQAAPDLAEYLDTPGSAEIAIDFGLTDVDTINRRYFMARNTGRGDLKVSGVAFSDGSSGDFFVNCLEQGEFVSCDYSSSSPLAVPPGEDLVLELAYAPRDVGLDEARLVLTTDAVDHSSLTLVLSGEGVTPEIEVCISNCIGDESGPACAGAAEICNHQASPMSMPFGEVDMDTRLTRDVTIRNLGDRPLQAHVAFVSGAYSQYELDLGDSGLPGVLETGRQVTIHVSYDPGTGGNHVATLRVSSNDVDEREIDIVLDGQGMAPRVCPDPLVLDFGNVPTGEAAVDSFFIFNCGLMDLDLEDVDLASGTSADFSFVNRPAFPATLRPNDSVEIQIQYHPQTQGSDAGGVDIFSNDPTSDPGTHLTGTVSLRGASFPRACDIAAVPFAVSFGSVLVGTPSTVSLGIANEGSDTCIFDRAAITANTPDNEFSIVSGPTDGTSFEPGDILQMVLQYQPTAVGQDTGTLSLYGNDKDGNEIRVDLNGQGVEQAVCDLAIAPTSHNFGVLRVNHTDVVAVQVTNLGQETCHVNRAELKQSFMTPGDFDFVNPFSSMTVGAGSRQDVEIVFAPDHPGQHASYLVLYTDDPDLSITDFRCQMAMIQPAPGQACIPLRGSSEEAAIAVVPDELDFSIVQVGCCSPLLTLTVYNLGTIDLHVSDIYLEDATDPNFVIWQAPNTPLTLGGGGSFTIKARYEPRDSSRHMNNLYIESDASNAPVLVVPLYGQGTTSSSQTDVFHQPNEVLSDVLFVIDNSGSMGEEQQALADNFDVFIQYALTLNVDFHLGVITTEVNDAETNMGSPRRDIFPGILVHPTSRPKYITNTTPDLQQAFRDNVSVGTCCSDEQEAGLEAAYMALSAPNIDDPAKNGGFMREDAKLYVIILSDEQDQSSGDPDFYVDFFSSIKGYRNPDRMAVSAIVGDSPNGCEGPGGSAGSGSRYIDVANRTGGVVESICTSDWAGSLSNLGLDAFAAIREFPLSRQADANTLVVTVNGVPVPQASCEGCADGWTYYGDTNSIYFGNDVVPEQGDTIVVDYEALCQSC
ncbi:MAG: choice-of-anchor D domain-containing protein [Deltaproteobacteria bacterium]|nr:choice-of-anchor D domain-containing protein [Deltaproteobacteria bacterium]